VIPSAPRIETERLVLRARKIEDFQAFAALWADPIVTRYTTGVPVSEEDAWARFARFAGFWPVNGYGFWIAEEKAGGAVIGEAGLAEFRRDMTPRLVGKPECGWVFAPAAHGKGYATEAMRAALAWADRNLRVPAFTCIIHPENAASIRVAEKLGFVETARSTYKTKPVVVFERIRP
jgi:RimJ/RimL family protein N-acetyltransferase